MIKCVSFEDIKLPIPGGIFQAGQAHSKDVRKRLQSTRRKAVLQPEVCLLEMSEAHLHRSVVAVHGTLIATPPPSKACSSRDWSSPG